MFLKVTVGGRICHAEYFTQRSDPIGFKHFNIHALGYVVLYFPFGYVKLIVKDTTVLHTLIVIGYVPFLRNLIAVRKQINASDQVLKEIPSAAETAVYGVNDLLIR